MVDQALYLRLLDIFKTYPNAWNRHLIAPSYRPMNISFYGTFILQLGDDKPGGGTT